jgi:nitrate reductase NapE component
MASYAHVLFTACFVVAGILALWVTIWQLKPVLKENEEGKVSRVERHWVGIAIKLVALWGVLTVLYIVGYGFMQKAVESSRPNLRNPAEEEAIERAKKHIPASEEELSENPNKLEDTRKRKHEEVIDDFEEKMKREAEKIRERNK